MNQSINVHIAGAGVWSPEFTDMEELSRFMSGAESGEPANAPKPERIPPRERRRAPLSVKIAVEVAEQACRAASMDPETPAVVFASAMGDTSITDYMCTVLAQNPELISPIKFHNSVHNAPAGYWAISTVCQQANSAICSYEHTLPILLLEAATQCFVEQRPVLAAMYDVPTPEPLNDIRKIDIPLGLALVLTPEQDNQPRLAVQIGDGQVDWPESDHVSLHDMAAANPAGTGMPVLESLLMQSALDTRYPLAGNKHLKVQIHHG